MAGQIKTLIDRIIEQRAKGNATVMAATKAKLIFKGLNPDKFTSASPDDPATLAKARAAAEEFGIRL